MLRGHRRAATEDATNASFIQIDFLTHGFERLRRREKTSDFPMLQDRDRLLDDVVHVSTSNFPLLLGDHLFDPARIQVNEVTNAAAKIGEVFDRQPKATWTG